MRSLIIALLLWSLIPSTAHATGTALQRFLSGADDGFWARDAVDAPRAVREAAEKTLRLVFALRSRDPWFAANGALLRQSLHRANSILAGPASARKQALPLLAQAEGLKECSPDGRACASIWVLSSCAGFATDGGRRLWTNAHCLENARNVLLDSFQSEVAGETNRAAAAGSRLVVLVFDRDFEWVAGPIELPGVSDLRTFSYRWKLDRVHEDFVSIDAAGFGLPSLEIASSPAPESRVWLSGYPMATGLSGAVSDVSIRSLMRRPRLFGRNSDGASLYLSPGLVFSREELGILRAKVANPSDYDVSIVEASHRRGRVWTLTADGIEGNSGGPALDESGRAVGIFSTYILSPLLGTQQARTASLVVRPPDWAER